MLKTDRSLPQSTPSVPNRSPYWRWLLIGILGLVAIRLIAHLMAEALWFTELQYLQVFSLRLLTRFGLFMLAFVISAIVLLHNMRLAKAFSWGRSSPSDDAINRQLVFAPMRLWLLLPMVLTMSFAIGIMVLYHGQIAVSHWHPQLSLYQVPTAVPLNFETSMIWHIGNELRQTPGWLGLLIACSIALLIYPLWMLRAIALLMSIGFGVVMSEQWSRVLLYFNPTSFEQADPLFNRDISFYVFQLPLWELLTFWLVGVSTLTLLSVGLVYLLSGNSLSQGKFPGLTTPHLKHLYGIGSSLMMAIALHYWINRYGLLHSPRGVTYGASYADVTVQLPAYTALSVIALVFGLLLLGRSLMMPIKEDANVSKLMPPTQSREISRPSTGFSITNLLPTQRVSTGPSSTGSLSVSRLPRSLRWLLPTSHLSWVLYGVVGYWAIATLGGAALPSFFQRVVVQPNELFLETPYIERTIALTRNALNLDDINAETFNPQPSLTFDDLQNHALTVNNIRLWDARPLLETNRQLQRIRLYYEFQDADVDRYTLTSRAGKSERRQVLISARELEYDDLSDEAKTWVNEHLIYTHGYGFTMSPVNTVGDGGLPDYFIRDIEHVPSNDTVRRSIPIGNPRIYYGELTDTYVMTQTQVRELDFPSGSENEYNTYDGSGGIGIGPFWKRLLFANHLHDWRMLLTQDFTPQTRLLYRRNIRDRAQAIAPFLRFDGDPYLVVADITQPSNGTASASTTSAGPTTALDEAGRDRLQAGLTQDPPNYLYWMIDAYTTSSRYPYADPIDRDFNYIRNSVKVVIDAYNGTTVFYVADETDPIIRSWEKVFPGMFLPLSAMPAPLREHIRYPQDYYQVQSHHLMTYHMTDPQVFYNREDEWRAPSEIYANEQQVVEPYYLTMELPAGDSEEFILLRPFTPIQRRNMIAWLAARSDSEHYGTQLLYTFPKQELVFGPEQIEARINQDPVISQQISLWNREGSRAVQGNLLVIPIEQSLLYVEPLYLEAEQNRLPTLVRVIVVFANQIAMAPSLDEALDAIFRSDAKDETPIILRSVDNTDTPPLGNDGLLSPDSVENGTEESAPAE